MIVFGSNRPNRDFTKRSCCQLFPNLCLDLKSSQFVSNDLSFLFSYNNVAMDYKMKRSESVSFIDNKALLFEHFNLTRNYLQARVNSHQRDWMQHNCQNIILDKTN